MQCKSESESKSHDDDDDHANKKKNMKKQKSNSEVVLPEDIMFSILSWVPDLKWLLNSARYVCKPWATIISTYHFAEAHFHGARAKPGIYVENLMSESSSYLLDIKDDDVMNGQFERTDLGTPPKMGRIISTCDGILLLCGGGRESFVVNPILKCWFRIPPLPFSQVNFSGFGHFTIARVPRTANFKLFFVHAAAGAHWRVLYVLRIGIDNTWKEIARKLEAPPLKWCLGSKPVYRGGNDLYWITTEGVIVIDVDTEIIVGEYPFTPPPNTYGMFLWMGNRLTFIADKYIIGHKDIKTIFQIYILDIESGKWTLYHEMGPFDFVAACGHEITWVIFRFWINDQIIFKATFSQTTGFKGGIHFAYNVKTRQLTKIEGIAGGCFEVWLHTNSLVSLPSTLT